jgi:hypothetical protein
VELKNRTAVPARIDVGSPLPNGLRRGIATAKATFSFDEAGRVTLETQRPMPLQLRDEAHPLGVLPVDVVPRSDPDFELMLLAHACAPRGTRVSRQTVRLALGDRERSIEVYGDRHWQGEGEAATIGAPAAFERLPLSWSRAYGGTVDVEVDEESPVEVQHELNAEGLGFDPASRADLLAEQLGCPEGFPRWDRRRALPNLEDPNALIRAWRDAPRPISWAPIPNTSGLHHERAFVATTDENGQPTYEPSPKRHLRAHPDWVLPEPPAPGTVLRLEGVLPSGPVAFAVPALEVHLDYVLGSREAHKQLAPRAMIVFADAMRFTIRYSLPFLVEPPRGEARKARLRLEKLGGGDR